MIRGGGWLLVCALLVALPAASGAEDSAGDAGARRCLGCHATLHDTRHLIADRYRESIHGDLDCLQCHDGARIAAIDAVHRAATAGATAAAPAIIAALRAKSRFPDALAACQGCHPGPFAAVRQGVHGQALLGDGNADAPFCTDCHQEIHYLRPVAEVASSVARGHVIETCAACHANRTLASRARLNAAVVESYQAHFHGKKYTLGGAETPTCAVCHGHHAIAPVAAPGGLATPAVKVALCARCHDGATPEFAAAFTHTPVDLEHNPVAAVARLVLTTLVAVTIALLSLHIALDLYAEARARRRPPRAPHIRAGLSWERYQRLPRQVERMDLHARIQHGVLLFAIVYLMASGLALKFPEQPFAKLWIGLWRGVENAGHLHRFAAVILICVVVYHLLYLAVLRRRGRLSLSMVPRKADAALLVANLRYLSGRSEQPPYFAKYTYYQKLDYWLVASVALVMIATGLMYWFPTAAARLLPAAAAEWIWGVAYTLHSTEAVLVLFFSFVWHFYNVHLKSRVFPMSWVWLDGKMALDDLLDEHPATFDALVQANDGEGSRADHDAPHGRGPR
jgi:cytochrome b subunit of formate dehydrogenase